MENNFSRIPFEQVIEIENIITLFYMELSKQFSYEGERHDFWELVYIDQGEMICTSEDNMFTLKNGELVFHQPNEFHNLACDGEHSPNVSIITFDCHSPAMQKFSGKIFKLTADEKNLLSLLFDEGLACFRMEDENNPLIQKLHRRESSPFGCSQMTKNLLEIFLIMLSRNRIVATRTERKNYLINGVNISVEVKQILDFMNERIYGSLSVKEIADMLHRSESYTKKLFTKYYPGGIIKYYNSLKAKEARRLIRNGEYSMAQISDILCFDSPQYFSRCFKQICHMTPSQYKKSIVK